MRIDQLRYRGIDPQRLPLESGYEVDDLQAWTPFPVTASDEGAGRSHKLNIGHAVLEVAVENSWRLPTGGPSGRDDLSKSRRDLLCGRTKARGHVATSGSPPRDEEIRAADRAALRETAGPIGKAQAPHIERRGYKNELRSGWPPKVMARSERVCCF